MWTDYVPKQYQDHADSEYKSLAGVACKGAEFIISRVHLQYRYLASDWASSLSFQFGTMPANQIISLSVLTAILSMNLG